MNNCSVDNPVMVGKENPYPVVFGRNLLTTLKNYIPDDTQKVLLIYPETVSHLAAIVTDNLGTDYQIWQYVHPDAEAAKTIEIASEIWTTCGSAQLGRRDLIISLGGGATTDLGGFIAATWLRGIRFINVPTTVLGMVDAAIGGKTGINTETGKNLVGCFYPPLAVICDFNTVSTLAQQDLNAGMAEVVKCGFIRDPRILELFTNESASNITDYQSAVFEELVMRAVAVKAEVVTADFLEGGLREILNYGHTLGHAIEKLEDYQWRHGEAISVGMNFAGRLAVQMGLLSPVDAAQQVKLLQKLSLPTTYSKAQWEALLEVMSSDKKVRSSCLRFVLLSSFGEVQTYTLTDKQIKDAETVFAEFIAVAKK